MIKGGVTCEDRGQKKETEKDQWKVGGAEEENTENGERKQEEMKPYRENKRMDL